MKRILLTAVFLILFGMPAAAAVDYDINYRDEDGVIIVQKPAKGDNWAIGSKQKIVWTYNGLTGRRIDILLLGDAKPPLVIANGADITDGEYLWQVPDNLAAGDYIIKIKSRDFPLCLAISDKFAIKSEKD